MAERQGRWDKSDKEAETFGSVDIMSLCCWDFQTHCHISPPQSPPLGGAKPSVGSEQESLPITSD